MKDLFASPFEDREIGFNARIFVQCNLPYRDPGPDLRQWSRVNGTAKLTIMPMVEELEGGRQISSFPYGSIPRLLMTYLTTMAIKYNRSDVLLGAHVADFMRSIGLDVQTNNRRRLRDQMLRLFRCAIRYSNDAKLAGGIIHEGGDVSVASEYRLWFNDSLSDESPDLFIPYVKLGERFFNEIINSGFPVDMEHIAALKKSPLGLDLYNWGVLRNNSVRKPVFIPWERLSEQFGNPYGLKRQFKAKAIREINHIKEVWKDWKADVGKDGLRISPSKPPIKKKVITVPEPSFEINKSTRTYKIWHAAGGSDEEYHRRLEKFPQSVLEPYEEEMLDDLLPLNWRKDNLDFFRMSKAIIGWRFNELVHVLNASAGVRDGLTYFRSSLLNAVELEAKGSSGKGGKE